MESNDEGFVGDVMVTVVQKAATRRRAKNRVDKLVAQALAVKHVEMKKSRPFGKKQRHLVAQKTTM